MWNDGFKDNETQSTKTHEQGFCKNAFERILMKRRHYLISLFWGLILLTSCSPANESSVQQEEKKPVPVRVMEIKDRDLAVVVAAVGRLAPNREVTLSAELGGVVESYSADIGDRVESGETLVSIDGTDYRLALKEANANLEVAQIRLHAAKNSFERTKSLLPRKVITPDAFDKSEMDYKSSRVTVVRVKVLVDIARERLNKTRIRAPFSGLIASRKVEIGQIVGTGQPLMTLVDLDPVRVLIHLPEKDYIHLDRDDPVAVAIEASPKSVFKGRIDRIGIKADERTNTFDVAILVDNPDLFLKAGMTARVRVTTAVIPGVIMIPQSAVLYRKDRKEVFVAGPDQKAEVREIELGRSEGALVQVLKGLIAGDRLVVTGGPYLKAGDRIMISASKQAGTL